MSLHRTLFAVAVATFAATASAAPAPKLAADPTAGQAPLVVAFDASKTAADNPTEQLLFAGNGEAIALGAGALTTTYDFSLPGAYQAAVWVRDGAGAVAASPPLAISVSRPRDGRTPPAIAATAARTTDPSTMAFMATLTASGDDEIVARRWELGDGETSGEEQPFHTYAQPGVYQAMLVATTKSGLPAYARLVVVVGDAAAPAPSMLVAVTAQDESLLTPVTVTGYVEGVAPDAKVTSAVVVWPDLEDASPAVTPTSAGLVVTSQHALAAPGWYDVTVKVQLAGRDAPVTGRAHVLVANPDSSMPSPLVLMAPVATATVGVPYAPGGEGPTPSSLLVAGNGPFAFGVAAPSPDGVRVDDAGHLSWTPTKAQVGPQRLAVRIVDADGRETVRTWVVDVAPGKSGGCSVAATAPSSSSYGAPLLLLALCALARRLRA